MTGQNVTPHAKGGCWAAPLGCCSGGLSREHLISQSLFAEDTVVVRGLPWCRDGVEIGVASFVGKILCRGHNSQLSPIDIAGAQFVKMFREWGRLENVREKLPRQRWTVVQRNVDGRSLERWFTKTLINLSCGHEFPIGADSEIAGLPSARLVKIAFGVERFSEKAGLYFYADVGMQVDNNERVSFALLLRDGVVEGGFFQIRGLRFVLCLESAGLPDDSLRGLAFDGADYGDGTLLHHPQKFVKNIDGLRSQVIKLRW